MRLVRRVGFVLLLLTLIGCQPLPESGRVPTLSLALYPSPTPSATPSATPTLTPWPTVNITAVPTPTATPAMQVTATPDPNSRNWAGRVGITNSPELPWEDQVDNARAENSVVLYADSGRSLTALENLARTMDGFSTEGLVATSLDIYLQLSQDLATGDHKADVVMLADAARTWGLVQQQRLWTYVPPDLVGVLNAGEQEGLLAHHWTGVTWVYNPQLGNPEVTSWWELTESSWAGRVAIADPRASERSYNVLAALDQAAPDLALDYYKRYGTLLVLDKDCPNAACQWFKKLLANQPLLLPGESEVAQAVGGAGVSEVRVGLCGLDILARVGGAPSVYPLMSLRPFIGWLERTYITIADQAPHPQAAKLAVRWLLGDPPCERGWSTWCLAGFFSYNSNIPDPEGLPVSRDLLPLLIDLSPSYAYQNQVKIESWITLQLIDRPLRYNAAQ